MHLIPVNGGGIYVLVVHGSDYPPDSLPQGGFQTFSDETGGELGEMRAYSYVRATSRKDDMGFRSHCSFLVAKRESAVNDGLMAVLTARPCKSLWSQCDRRMHVIIVVLVEMLILNPCCHAMHIVWDFWFQFHPSSAAAARPCVFVRANQRGDRRMTRR